MQLSPAEHGYSQPPATTVGDQPPGGGRWAVSDFLRYGALFSGGFRGYRWWYDEALKHSASNARAMRNDPVVMHALRSRQMAVSMLSWHLEPRDEDDPRQQDAVKLVESILHDFPRFQRFRMHQCEARWYGRSANEVRYRWDFSKPNPFHPKGRRLIPVGYQYFNGDKLRFKWDGSVGVMVNSLYDGEKESTDFGYAHFLSPTERECFVVNHFEPEDADYWEPDLAGGVMGTGIRSRIYWLWYLKQQILAQVMNFTERFANGFTIYYYDGSNPEARTQMLEALQQQDPNTNSLLIPRWGDGSTNGVERLEVGTTTPQFLLALIEDVCNAPILKYILGQELSSSTAPTGLGSGVADLHGDTYSQIIKYDAQNDAETLTTDLVSTLYRYNCPGVPPARFVYDIDVPNATEVLQNAELMQSMGLAIDGDHLYDVTGLPKPISGDTAVSKLQPQSAVGVAGEQPVGVPAAGEPLPPGAEQQPEQMSAMPSSRSLDTKLTLSRLRSRFSKARRSRFATR